jgi:hypothetical protein
MKENEINVCFHIGGVQGNQKSLVTDVIDETHNNGWME